MNKLIHFDEALQKKIQAYANKYNNGNFSAAARELLLYALSKKAKGQIMNNKDMPAMQKLSSEFEYSYRNGLCFMYATTPDGCVYILGTFRKTDDYYRFYPDGTELTCKMLREAAKKCSNLNMDKEG